MECAYTVHLWNGKTEGRRALAGSLCHWLLARFTLPPGPGPGLACAAAAAGNLSAAGE